MNSQAIDLDRVRSARHALIAAGLHASFQPEAPLSPGIDRSWRRSIGVGASPRGEVRFVNEYDKDSELYRAARPVLDGLQATLHDMGVAVFLSDARGQIVARRASSHTEVARLDAACAAEGFDFSEDSIGTNGLGTAMNECCAVFVRGPEHFNDVLEGLACAGMGIRHPVNGRVVGALALASAAESAETLMLALTRQATQQIVRNLAEGTGRRDLALTETYQTHRKRGPVIVLNRDTVMTNVAGLPFISVDGHAQLWETLLGLDWVRSPQQLVLDLPVLHATVLAYRIEEVVDDPSFAVEVLKAPKPAPTSLVTRLDDRPRSSRSAPVEGCTTAQADVVNALTEAWSRKRGLVLITGPSGSGKLHTARRWLSTTAGGEPVVMSLADMLTTPDAADRVATALDSGRSVVLRRAEDLQGRQFNWLKDLAVRMRGQTASETADQRDPRVVITADRTRCTVEVLDLLAGMTTECSLPGLAASRDSVPQLIASISSELEPGLRPALSAGATQALMRWHWPANITELRSTLAQLSAERPGQTVSPEHLPEHLRLAQRRRRLSRIEAAERGEIVAALRQAGGNRSAAAGMLGIGRTTLYRKLQSLDITSRDELAL